MRTSRTTMSFEQMHSSFQIALIDESHIDLILSFSPLVQNTQEYLGTYVHFGASAS